MNRVELLQKEKPLLRTVGVGVDYDESTAKSVAELQARGEFVRKMSDLITTATEVQTDGMTLTGTDGQSVTDHARGVKNLISGVERKVVKNTSVIDYIKYKLPNNQYQIYVCLEYLDGISEMADEIAKTVVQQIPEDQKLKVKFEFDRYKKQVEEDLKSYKEEQ
ncbi:MAG: hypothetical protein LBL07_00580 [Tannerella sp.]|nr:hypothetical protein [Tannerella sp.]